MLPHGQFKQADAEDRTPSSMLRPGRNVWRVERAARVHLLVDAANYFAALRQAMISARRSITIIGWDIDSRTRFVGSSRQAEDGLPECFGEFLSALAIENPDLKIRLLLWKHSVIYWMEREFLPAMPLRWSTPPNIDLCLDSEAPPGASQHQKIVVIDGCLAFSGGLDLTIRRWDTCSHDPDNAQRTDPAGKPYRPFHDVQLMVDGSAARALNEIACQRWQQAACEPVKTAPADTDPWPAPIKPHFTSVTLGIARTVAPRNGLDGCREIEHLFLDMASRAERWIYIENQFLTCRNVAEVLAKRLREKPGLEVILVVPKTHETWIEHRTMLAGRIRFMNVLREAGVSTRVRLLYPWVAGEEGESDVMVHSKVMIVDDRLLRVGSANLNNRSMGTDTECDLVIEAQDEEDRAGIRQRLAELLGEHCGAEPDDVSANLTDDKSLFSILEKFQSERRGLRAVEDGDYLPASHLTTVEKVADPLHPLVSHDHLTELASMPDANGKSGWPVMVKVVVALMVVAALGLIWQYTPLSTYADPEVLRRAFDNVEASPFVAPIILAIFILGGLIAFPLTVLVLVTAGTFGFWPGTAYALIGSMSSAWVTYGAGRLLGKRYLRNFIGPRINRVSKEIGKHGVPAIATIRLVPVAPFTLVNLVAGALRIPVLDYTLGTLLGLVPGIFLMSLMGDRVFILLRDPSLTDLAIIVVAFAAWIAMAFGLQRLVARWQRSD